MKRIVFLVTFLLSFGIAKAHPIKLTTGKLTLSSTDTVADFLLNFFLDDFEPEMRKMYPQPPFNFDDPSDEMKASIQNYVRKNVAIWVDNVPGELFVTQITKLEENVCQVQFKLSFKKAPNLHSIKVRNTLLFSSFEKQSNVIHLFTPGGSHHIMEFYPNRPVEVINL